MPLSSPTRAMIDALGTQHGVTLERLRNLRQAIESAPLLVEQTTPEDLHHSSRSARGSIRHGSGNANP